MRTVISLKKSLHYTYHFFLLNQICSITPIIKPTGTTAWSYSINGNNHYNYLDLSEVRLKQFS